MNAVLGLVNNTIKFSVVDGPGNRFVIFTQGCNFNCVTCHNPYTISECTSCGVCVGPCPENALTIERGPLVVVDRNTCTLCDICIDVCPIDSTPLATSFQVAELIDQIRQAAPFISGVTVSGGEATLQPDFVRSLFLRIKADPTLSHLTTLIDSNGSASVEVWNQLSDVMDGAMIDLKALDNNVHIQLTARTNNRVLAAIKHLAALDKLYEVRLLIVPGYNDDEATMERTSAWLHTIDPEMRIRLIGYRPHGVRPESDHIPEATSETLDPLAAILKDKGFSNLTVV
ncbi:MAG: YjjW family glycine radical enzyme activase [Acidimicrobiia bacterium]|nr:MAG: YjjW family glycine radical enzyme activase [Acidimicrobiia bacterium]